MECYTVCIRNIDSEEEGKQQNLASEIKSTSFSDQLAAEGIVTRNQVGSTISYADGDGEKLNQYEHPEAKR